MVCPENGPFLNWIEGDAVFSEEETSLLMSGTAFKRFPAETIDKVRRFDMADLLEVLPRNLLVLLRQENDRSS
jgi:hypothetical protein